MTDSVFYSCDEVLFTLRTASEGGPYSRAVPKFPAKSSESSGAKAQFIQAALRQG